MQLSNDLEAAINACERGRLADALELCQSALERDPRSSDALHLIGVIHGMQGDHAGAIAHFERAVELAADRVDYRRNLCRAYLQVKRWEGAEQVINDGLRIAPQSSQLWQMLGIVHAQQQRWEPAIEAYHRAIGEVSPTGPEASGLYFGLSELQRMRGDNSQATKALQIALQLDPNNIQALNNLAGLELFSGDFLPALKTIKRLLEVAPRSAQPHFNLARLLEVAGDLPQAIVALKNALTFDPNLTAAKFLIASLQSQLGELDEAETLLGELFQKMGHDSAECLTLLAKIQERRGQLDEAQQTLDRIPDKFALHPEVATTRAIVAEQQGRYEQAIAGLEAVLATDTYAAAEGIGIYFMLGQLYDMVGQYDLAFDAYRSGNENRKRAFISVEGEVSLAGSAFDQLSRLFSSDLFGVCPSSDLETEVPVFIVGMPRSGTTLVEQILASHSEVHGAGELAWIQDGLASSYPKLPQRTPLEIVPADRFRGEHCIVPYGWGHNTSAEITRIAEGYLRRLVALSPLSARITDKLPYNFFLLPIIHRLFPKARIIHCQRNPLDTCLSCYFQNFTSGNRFSFGLETLGQFYVDYRRLMGLWTEDLGIPVHHVSYENLIGHPEEIARGLLDYCGLDWQPECLKFHRSSRTVNTASYQQVRRPIYTSSIGRAKHYLHRLNPLIEIVKTVEPACDVW